MAAACTAPRTEGLSFSSRVPCPARRYGPASSAARSASGRPSARRCWKTWPWRRTSAPTARTAAAAPGSACPMRPSCAGKASWCATPWSASAVWAGMPPCPCAPLWALRNSGPSATRWNSPSVLPTAACAWACAGAAACRCCRCPAVPCCLARGWACHGLRRSGGPQRPARLCAAAQRRRGRPPAPPCGQRSRTPPPAGTPRCGGLRLLALPRGALRLARSRSGAGRRE